MLKAQESMLGAIEAQEYWGPGENQIPSRSHEHQVCDGANKHVSI